MDFFEEEMARGKTHQSSKVGFRFAERDYVLVDTPGHSICSMIEGVYAVKIAGLIIPMINNEFESAFKRTFIDCTSKWSGKIGFISK